MPSQATRDPRLPAVGPVAGPKRWGPNRGDSRSIQTEIAGVSRAARPLIPLRWPSVGSSQRYSNLDRYQSQYW